MPTDYRTVRLMKNRLYPTYQLHAVMAARKTTPENGLKIGALTILDWVRHRLGTGVPEELNAPLPEEYAAFPAENLHSFHTNEGYVIDIVSLPAQGVWTMQIVEPDLGSDPGNPDQRRAAVPGRVIESNISFTISNGELHCGFRTMISDPMDTAEKCEVYRPAFVRLLADNPQFGLRQVAPLTQTVSRVETMEQLRQLAALHKNPACHLPVVVFTQVMKTAEPTPFDIAPEDIPPDMRISVSSRPIRLPNLPELPQKMDILGPKTPADPAFDLAAFAKSGLGYCRTVLLTDEMRTRFAAMTGHKLAPGDTLYWESESLGGAAEQFPYPPSTASREKLLAALMSRGRSHTRERDLSLAPCVFVAEAKRREQAEAQNLLRRSAEAEARFKEKLERETAACRGQMDALREEKDPPSGPA